MTLHDTFSNLSEISSRQTFWLCFMIIRLKMWPLDYRQGFSKIWLSDLIFDTTWPIFNFMPVSSRQTCWSSFMIIRLKMKPLECCNWRPLLQAWLFPYLNTIPNNYVIERILFSSVVMVLAYQPGGPGSNPVWTLYFCYVFIHFFLCYELFL